MRLDEAPPPIETETRDESVVPDPPKKLCRAERDWWNHLWRTPVAAVWTASDGPIVSTLAKLLALADEEVTAGIAGQIASIGSQLGLNPRSRAQLRISVAKPTAPVVNSRDRFRSVG
jgi:hypothetical protein